MVNYQSKIKVQYYFGLLLFVCSVFLVGCKKDNDEDGPNFPSTSEKVIVCGRILNEWNSPIENAEVTLGSTTVLTDANGLYALNQVAIPADRGVIKVKKTGYISNYIGVSAEQGIQYINTILPAAQNSYFQNGSGGTITVNPSGCKLIFPPDAVVNEDGSPFSGQVLVQTDISDISDSLYRLKFPGSDRMAIDIQNSPQQFRTYSFAYIGLVTGASVPLKMAPGKTATIQLPIPSSQISAAPATTALCSFNEQTGLWVEETIATKNGNFYEATVSHFSFWGCGSLHSAAYLKGRVLDCNNNPIANTLVFFDIDNYEFTNNDGYFIKRVPGNLSFQVVVPPANSLGVFSQPFNIGPITPGQQYDMGDIVLQCPAYLSGMMQDCNGSGAAGWVDVNYGSQFGFTGIYSTTGSFTVPVKSNMNVTMRYVTPTKIVTSTASTPLPNVTANLGNISVCYIPDTANTITINGAGFVNETLTLDVTGSEAQYRQTGMTYLSLTGTTLQGKTVTIYAYFNGNSPGTYNCNSVQTNYIRVMVNDQVHSIFKSFSSETPTSSCDMQILTYGNEIGRLKAYLSGTLTTSAVNGSQPVTISGKMDLARLPDWRTSGLNALTANGDGFANQTISFDWCPATSFFGGYIAGNYKSATNETVLKYAGCMSSSNGGFGGTLKFNGNTPGVYSAPSDFYSTSFHIRKEFNGVTTKKYDELVSGTLTINSYPPPGGYITGTFSGIFKRTDPVTGQVYQVNVTNASISSWHYPDE